MDVSETGSIPRHTDADGMGHGATKTESKPSKWTPDDDWKLECLIDYVRDRMTPYQFAEHIGMQLPHVYAVLAGQRWKHIPRPEGFEYPWPERARLGNRKSFLRCVHAYDEAVRLRDENGWSLARMAEFLGVHKGSAFQIYHRTKLWRERGY